MTKGQQAIRELYRVMANKTGNLPPLPRLFPDYAAPVVLNGPDGCGLTMARWGMPTSSQFLKTATDAPIKSNLGATNIHNTKSPHWRRWLGPGSRCLVPLTSFSENRLMHDGSRPPVWFAFDETRPPPASSASRYNLRTAPSFTATYTLETTSSSDHDLVRFNSYPQGVFRKVANYQYEKLLIA